MWRGEKALTGHQAVSTDPGFGFLKLEYEFDPRIPTWYPVVASVLRATGIVWNAIVV